MSEEQEKHISERREERSKMPETFTESPSRMMQRFHEDMHRLLGEFPGSFLMESPLRMMQRFRDEMDRFLSEAPASMRMMESLRQLTPSIDVSETDNEIMVRADLPGVDPDNVEIFTTEDTIRIRGEIKQEAEEKEKGFYRSERRYGMFDRTIPLPVQIKSDQAKASFKHGVLEIKLPKTEQAREKMKKVPIETEERMVGAKGGERKEGQPQKKSSKK